MRFVDWLLDHFADWILDNELGVFLSAFVVVIVITVAGC